MHGIVFNRTESPLNELRMMNRSNSSLVEVNRRIADDFINQPLLGEK